MRFGPILRQNKHFCIKNFSKENCGEDMLTIKWIRDGRDSMLFSEGFVSKHWVELLFQKFLAGILINLKGVSNLKTEQNTSLES